MSGRSFVFWPRVATRQGQTRSGTSRRTKKGRQAERLLSSGGRFETLESRELLTVTYQGGALLTSVEAQGVYLGSAWSTNSSLQAQAQSTDQYLSALVGGSYMDMLNNAGYGVGRGTASAGAVDNIGLSGSISDSQIRSDLAAMIGSGKVQAPDANRLYMVYVEPGVEVTMGSANSKTSFLGYHGAFADGGNVIHYAVLPFPGTPNPNPGSQGFASNFDELTTVSSHELAEAVTDPNVNFSTLGWYDFQRNGEIGDLAQGHDSTITGANGVQYEVQDVVDQNDQIISPNSSQPSPTPTPTPTPTPAPSLTAPTLTVSAVSTTVAKLSWTAVSGTDGYNVYEVVNGQNVLLGTVSSSTTAVDVTGITPGSTVTFVVEAFNSTTVADSSPASVTMPAPAVQSVTAPQVTATAASATSVNLSWGAESQATGYNIYWSNGYQVVFLGTVNGSTNSVTVTGLWPGSHSYFLVEAFNNVSRADSHWVYVTTPFSSSGYGGGFGGYAEAYGGYGGFAASFSPSIAPNMGGGHARWGRY
jgi:hypothetical protein